MNYIAKWDSSTWSGLGTGLNERVNNLAVDSRGNLYTDVLIIPDSGLPETVVMRWDGSSWSVVEGDLSGLVDALAEGRDSNILITDLVVDSRDQLYASGHFYLISIERHVGYVARWDGSNWTLLGSGMNHTVYHLAVDGQDNLFAGGEFTSAGGVPANRIAKWDGGSWRALGSGLGGEAPIIADLAADESGNLFVAGQFDSAGGMSVRLIAMWDGATWTESLENLPTITPLPASTPSGIGALLAVPPDVLGEQYEIQNAYYFDSLAGRKRFEIYTGTLAGSGDEETAQGVVVVRVLEVTARDGAPTVKVSETAAYSTPLQVGQVRIARSIFQGEDDTLLVETSLGYEFLFSSLPVCTRASSSSTRCLPAPPWKLTRSNSVPGWYVLIINAGWEEYGDTDYAFFLEVRE